jgi:DMSO/TMAO reductase YedYZ molybdopterin-dependent catalytic subunit
LLVPGWYGFACIKWVQQVTLVDGDSASTSQMREFASRTAQDGVPELAREFRPAKIQLGALPIRVEKWLVGGKLKYRVVGLCWGGSRPATSLLIRFNPEEDYVPVQNFRPAPDNSWTVWTHDWSPTHAGTYLIRLLTKDENLTQRLNSGSFVREVEVEEV